MAKHLYDMTYLYNIATTNSHDVHSMHRRSHAHHRVVKRLGSIDGHVNRQYPFLNVSLKKKYLKMIYLAEGLGAVDEGDISTSIIYKYLKEGRL